ncbi:MAG: hypothetical protein DME04_10565 [Candidatus Rokuibacteriota bacterium]|nr:MAG: hypothetical protein DME04_10565 [Candidatus Rokubacteria bacterium]
MGIVVRVAINAVAIYLAARLVPGIELRGEAIWPALLAGLVLAILNAVVRPLLVLITLPLTLVTLGLFLLVLNAFCLWLTAVIVTGFVVHGFRAALLGSLVISVVSWVLTIFVSDAGRIGRLGRF